MIKSIFILLFLSFVSLNSLFAQTCSYCHGTGKLERNSYISTYGINNSYHFCKVCGKKIYAGNAHTHITCKYCNGTGKSQSVSSSRRSSSSSSSSSNVVAVPIEREAYLTIMSNIEYLISGLDKGEYNTTSLLGPALDRVTNLMSTYYAANVKFTNAQSTEINNRFKVLMTKYKSWFDWCSKTEEASRQLNEQILQQQLNKAILDLW